MSTEEWTEHEEDPRGTSRRGFLKLGAGGLAAAGATATGVVGLNSAGAARGRKIELFINDGVLRMVDGTPVYMWRFSKRHKDANGDLIAPARPPVLHAKAGEVVRISVRNNLDEPHSFVIRGVVNSGPIAPGKTWRRTFRAPRAGTYLYEDGLNRPVNRVLGLGGPFCVRHPGLKDRPFPGGPRFFGHPFVWTLQDVDPVWQALARAGRQNEIKRPLKTFLPRYFNINGKGGFQSMEDHTVHVKRRLNQKTWICIVNTGLAVHACHWHGNHVFVWARNGRRAFDALPEEDVLAVAPGDRVDVLLPCHEAQDAWPRELGFRSNCFPMHCHAEMSQTAGGGFYPGGMVTDWELIGRDHA